MTTDGCGIRRSVLADLIKAQPKAGRILVGAAFASAWIVAGGIRSGAGAQHVDVKSLGECSGDGAPAVAGESAATDSRDGGAPSPLLARGSPRCASARGILDMRIRFPNASPPNRMEPLSRTALPSSDCRIDHSQLELFVAYVCAQIYGHML